MHSLFLYTLNNLLKTGSNVVISCQHLAYNLVKLMRISYFQVIQPINYALEVEPFGLDIIILQRHKVGDLKDDHSKYENIGFLLLILVKVIIVD